MGEAPPLVGRGLCWGLVSGGSRGPFPRRGPRRGGCWGHRARARRWCAGRTGSPGQRFGLRAGHTGHTQGGSADDQRQGDAGDHRGESGVRHVSSPVCVGFSSPPPVCSGDDSRMPPPRAVVCRAISQCTGGIPCPPIGGTTPPRLRRDRDFARIRDLPADSMSTDRARRDKALPGGRALSLSSGQAASSGPLCRRFSRRRARTAAMADLSPRRCAGSSSSNIRSLRVSGASSRV